MTLSGPSTPAAQLQDLGLYLKYKTFDAMSLDRKQQLTTVGSYWLVPWRGVFQLLFRNQALAININQ